MHGVARSANTAVLRKCNALRNVIKTQKKLPESARKRYTKKHGTAVQKRMLIRVSLIEI